MMRPISLLSVLISIFCAAGCASERVVEISVPPVESSQYESKTLSETEAVQVLRDVARQNGFEIHGPIRQRTNQGSISIYTAFPTRNSLIGRARLDLYTSDRTTVFHCVGHDLNTLRKMSSLLERALDKQGLRYSATETTANPLNR